MAIPFVKDMDFTYGAVTQMSPLIRRVICNNPSPFTFMGTGTYIVGTGDVAVIDPGPLNEAHIDAICAALGPDEQISHILITHTHLDHSPAARPLKERCGAPICGYHAADPAPHDTPTHQTGAHDAGAQTTDLQMSEAAIQMEEDQDADYAPDIILADGDRLSGPTWDIEVLHTPGHMANHLCFSLLNEKTLFSGDHVMGWSTSIVAPPDGNMNAYMDSLERLLARDETRYLPTHGPAIDDPQSFVRAYINHRRQREAQIIEQLSRGVTRIRDMVPTLYAETDPRLYPAAALSVYAHIEDLLIRQIAICTHGHGLEADYRLNTQR